MTSTAHARRAAVAAPSDVPALSQRTPSRALSKLDGATGQLPKTVLPLKVSAHIGLDPYRDDFHGSARYELRVRQPVRTITLHARDLSVADARLAGVRQPPAMNVDAKQQTVTLRFARPVPSGRHELTLRFSVKLDQQRLLADTWAGAQTGAMAVSRLLELLDRIELRTPPAVWRASVQYGMALHALLYGVPEQAAVRGDLVVALGRLDDAEVIDEARRRFAERERQPALLAGDVGSAVLRVVGRHADVATWEVLLTMLGDRRYVGTMSWPLSQALSSSRDAAVARHAMQASLDGRLPRNVADRIFGGLARERARASEVWAFVQSHRRVLLDRSSEMARGALYPAAISASRDTTLAREVLAASERDMAKDMQEETRRAVA